MKKNIIFILCIACLVISSCKKSSTSNKNVEEKKIMAIKISDEIYSEVSDSLKIESDFKETDKIKKIKITSSSIIFLIQTIDEHAYLNVGATNEKEISSWHIVDFNFSYDASIEDALKDIHLLTKKNQSDGYLMFPSTTEQYATYYLYKYSQNLIEYIGMYEDDSFGSFKGKFIYNETQHDLYIQSKTKEIRKLKLVNAQPDNVPANIIEREKTLIIGQAYDLNYINRLSNKNGNNELEETDFVNKTENSTLSKTFIFKFSTSRIEDKDGNEIQKIKINLKNKETNKIQELDFTPESLITQFDGTKTNSISYFDKEKSIIKSYQEIEGGMNLIALDVNFDGLEDFAIINYQGSNGGPQYAYYVQKPNKQFVLDSYLTQTVRFFPFEINKNKKILTIVHPSGCCQIQTYKFQIQPSGEWKNIYSNLEDMK